MTSVDSLPFETRSISSLTETGFLIDGFRCIMRIAISLPGSFHSSNAKPVFQLVPDSSLRLKRLSRRTTPNRLAESMTLPSIVPLNAFMPTISTTSSIQFPFNFGQLVPFRFLNRAELDYPCSRLKLYDVAFDGYIDVIRQQCLSMHIKLRPFQFSRYVVTRLPHSISCQNAFWQLRKIIYFSRIASQYFLALFEIHFQLFHIKPAQKVTPHIMQLRGFIGGLKSD